jgi:Flp pilus assembly protein TadG
MVRDMFAVNREAAPSSGRNETLSRARRVRARVRRDGERGAALVEFALVLPIFLIVTFGMISMGLLMNEYLELTEVCNIGGQQLALMRNNSDPCKTVYDDLVLVSPHIAASAMTLTFTLNGTVYGPFTGSASSCTAAFTQFQAIPSGTLGTPVTLSIQYTPQNFNFFYVISPIPVSTYQFGAQITEVLQ